MSRYLKVILTVLSAVILLTACSFTTESTPEAQSTVTSFQTTDEAARLEPTATLREPTSTSQPQSITLVDDLGREIEVLIPVRKIVSLAPSVTECLFTVGAGSQVIGRTDYCNYPEEVLDLPSIGGFSASSISVEAIVALEPDLVIGGAASQVEVIQALEEAGIPAFVTEPATLAEIMDTLSLLGEITGHIDEATVVIGKMQASINAVKEKVSIVPDDQRPTVFYEVWHEPLMSANRHTIVGELIDVSGGVNIFANLPDEYPTVSEEQIVEADPRFIIGPSSHGDQMSAEVIGAREGWEDLSAVQNNAIYIVDGDMVSRASPRVVIVLNEFARILHPDLFE